MQQHGAVGSSVFFSEYRAGIQRMTFLDHCHHGSNTPSHVKCKYNLAFKGCVSVSICFLRNEYITKGKKSVWVGYWHSKKLLYLLCQSCFSSLHGRSGTGCVHTLAICMVLSCWCPTRLYSDSRQGTVLQEKSKVCWEGSLHDVLMAISVWIREDQDRHAGGLPGVVGLISALSISDPLAISSVFPFFLLIENHSEETY